MSSSRSLPRCAFDTKLASGIDIPGFDGALPDAVFVRSISQGTLEQITFRLGLLHALRESGVRVWNDARAIERCVDKSATTFLLHKAGIPTPRTRTMETKPPADTYVAGAERPLIYKPLFGSQGKGLLRIDDVAGLPAPEAADNIYYLQDFVPPSGSTFEDWRVIVTRSRVVAAMTRRAGNWITNVHQGGEPSAHEPSEEMAQLASARACGGRRRLRRRRSDPHAGRALAGARGEQQSFLARTAERVRRRHRGNDRRGFPPRRRRASAAHIRAAFRTMPRLSRSTD